MSEDSQFNSTSRDPNIGKNYSSRKSSTPSSNKFNDNKGNRYSPSTSYNYNGQTRGSSNFQNPRRRVDRFKRDSTPNNNTNDKLIKQNDTIIRLLKEIRDGISTLSPQVLKKGREEKAKTKESVKTKETIKTKEPIKTKETVSNTVSENKKTTAKVEVTPKNKEQINIEDSSTELVTTNTAPSIVTSEDTSEDTSEE